MKTFLVAKRDVNGFCITDVDGYELIFNLKKGSTIQVCDAREYEDDPEIYVDIYPDETVMVGADDFEVRRED
jgi:hypothetical protein